MSDLSEKEYEQLEEYNDKIFYYDTSTNDEEYEESFRNYVKTVMPETYSIEEINKKAEQYRTTGDSTIREKLILTNLSRVSRRAKKVSKYYGVDEKELASSGYLGLIEFVDKFFKENKTTKFYDYIMTNLYRLMDKIVADNIGVSVDLIDDVWKEKVWLELENGNDKTPTIEEVLDSLESKGRISTPKKNKTIKQFKETGSESIEELLNNDLDIASNDNLEENLEYEYAKEKLEEAVHTLTPREEKIIKGRYNLGALSQYEEYQDVQVNSRSFIASKLNISGVRVLQIEKKALKKMRQPSRQYILSGIEDLNLQSEDHFKTTHDVISNPVVSDYDDIEYLELYPEIDNHPKRI